jgi:hypothetical protein
MGLARTHGSYKKVVELFNMAPGDYKRFLTCLRKHQCQGVSLRRFALAGGAGDAIRE